MNIDALETLGTLLPPEGGGRDAIHIAVLPVVAGDLLAPGRRVEVYPGTDGALYARRPVRDDDPTVGIIDPFLAATARPGERCWLLLNPRTITGLRHVWTHPAFGDEAVAPARPSGDKAASEAWLRDFTEHSDCPDYDTVIAAAFNEYVPPQGPGEHLPAMGARTVRGYYNDGEYLHFDGQDAHGDIPDEFWDHLEIVTGRDVPRRLRARYFSCRC